MSVEMETTSVGTGVLVLEVVLLEVVEVVEVVLDVVVEELEVVLEEVVELLEDVVVLEVVLDVVELVVEEEEEVVEEVEVVLVEDEVAPGPSYVIVKLVPSVDSGDGNASVTLPELTIVMTWTALPNDAMGNVFPLMVA